MHERFPLDIKPDSVNLPFIYLLSPTFCRVPIMSTCSLEKSSLLQLHENQLNSTQKYKTVRLTKKPLKIKVFRGSGVQVKGSEAP